MMELWRYWQSCVRRCMVLDRHTICNIAQSTQRAEFASKDSQHLQWSAQTTSRQPKATYDRHSGDVHQRRRYLDGGYIRISPPKGVSTSRHDMCDGLERHRPGAYILRYLDRARRQWEYILGTSRKRRMASVLQPIWNLALSRKRYDEHKAFQVFACWIGAAVFSAKPLTESKIIFRKPIKVE
jgi:hypothetical protein